MLDAAKQHSLCRLCQAVQARDARCVIAACPEADLRLLEITDQRRQQFIEVITKVGHAQSDSRLGLRVSPLFLRVEGQGWRNAQGISGCKRHGSCIQEMLKQQLHQRLPGWLYPSGMHDGERLERLQSRVVAADPWIAIEQEREACLGGHFTQAGTAGEQVCHLLPESAGSCGGRIGHAV
ncbi:hypothetical protein D9M71_581820 [compost metagenome]